MRLIQAGVGGYGGSWLWAIRETDGFEHVALVDSNPEALRAAGEVTGVPADRQFTGLEEALKSVQADGFVNVTPAPLHAETSIAAMETGLHVLVEKPIAPTMADAQRMVEVAERLDRKMMVTMQYRYQDQPRCLRQLIRDGAIGTVDHVVVEFQMQGLLAGWRREMDQPLLLDMAIHHFDLMRYFFGENARTVLANTWNPAVSNTQGDMNAYVWIEFESGVRVNYIGAWASPGTDTGWNGRWVITGSKGTLIWNQKDDWGPIRLFKQDADLSKYTEQHFFTPLLEIWGEPIWAESIGPTGHAYDLYHWRACIQQNVEPETSGRDNLNTLALTLAAVESAATCRWSTVNDQFEPSRLDCAFPSDPPPTNDRSRTSLP